jgi:hypothetical protein
MSAGYHLSRRRRMSKQQKIMEIFPTIKLDTEIHS